MSDSAIERSLLESLNAYVKHFEILNTREDLLAIAYLIAEILTLIKTAQQKVIATANQ